MAEEGSAGIVETRYYTYAEPPHEMQLDSGDKLGPITLAYETYGTLNGDASNAILITHALSGDAHVAGIRHAGDLKPGWWDGMVGPGKAFDTSKYFVICSNVLGGCMGSTGPASVNPATGKPYGLDFPIITIGDMVRAQRQLVTFLGVDTLLTVAGGSMGGMQALEWATRYPDDVKSVMCIATTHFSGAQQIAFDAVGRNAIMADVRFNHGDYYDSEMPAAGLGIARMLAHITYLSDESMRAKFGRRLREREKLSYEFESEFSVETYLDYQGAQFVNRFDPNTYLYITKAMDYFDISAPYGSLDKAMAAVKCRVLVISFSSDWLYPPYQSEEIVYALTRQEKDVTYCCIESNAGHDAFLLEFNSQKKIVAGFLDTTMNPNKIGAVRLDDDSEAEYGPPPRAASSIYEGHRVDYDMIVSLLDRGSKVLDVGCGDGELLCQLVRQKCVRGMGLDKSEGNVVACARRGISVVQADIDRGLSALPAHSFDWVILSMTLQVIEKPEQAIREMLRVGRRCIISFPNFGHWTVRWSALFHGRAPVTRALPYTWHESPNRHMLSIKDFRQFCDKRDIRIEKEIPLTGHGEGRFLPNVMAEEAVFVISAKDYGNEDRAHEGA
jgi:homoserine O-acetyltransferase